jgi:2-oxoisovalerate dehydrogenase E1 component beta subunit
VIVPIGKARVARAGGDLSIITYGAMVHHALTAAQTLADESVDVEVLDLRSLKPLDRDALLATARKTGKVLVVHAANRLAGVGAEIAAFIAEEAFEWLDAPVQRMGGLDTPVPFSPPLEDAYRPDAARIARAARALARY